MSDAFDPYRKWLGIPPAEQPPHHYRLLGVGLYEDDPDVIESAADQRMAHLRTFQAGPHSALSQKLLNEVVAAKICLLSAKQRAAYDAELRQRLSPPEPAVERPRPVAAPMQPVAVAPIVAAAVCQDPLETAMASLAASQPLATRPRAKPKSGPPLVWWLAGAGGLFVLVVAALVISSRPEAPAAADRGVDRSATKPGKPVEASVAKAAAAAKPSPPKVSPGALEPPPANAPFDAKQARAHQEAWAAYLKTPVEQTNSLGMSLVLIPPGEFTMGSTPEQIAAAKEFARQSKKLYLDWTLERIDAEAPAHRVKLSRPFLMGATEVTIGQYRRFVKATSYVTETERFGGGSSTNKEEKDPQKKALNWRGPSYPTNDQSAVVEITWNDAAAFCNWLSEAENKRRCYQQNEQGQWVLDRAGDGYRLPTEAEWEYACRAGGTLQYGFGDDATSLGQYGWSDKTGTMAFPVAVGSKLPNPFGLYDMHGNAEEWCYDWFAPKCYAESPADDPAGPASGDHRIKRGGTWDGPIVNCRATFRGSYPPFWRYGDLGFRVLRVSTAVANSGAPQVEMKPASSNPPQAGDSAPPPAVAPFDAKQARMHQEAWAAHLKRTTVKPNSIGMPLVVIPPGEFTMGSTPEQIAAAKQVAEQQQERDFQWTLGRIDAEAPAHRVKISRPFLMGATEVTIGQYGRFVNATNYVTETERFGGGDSTKKDEQDPQKKGVSWRLQGAENSAVRQITWADAAAFCNWLSGAENKKRCYLQNGEGEWELDVAGDGYRLPTETEWEYACRAGTTTQFSFGDDASAFGEFGWSAAVGPVPHPLAVGSKIANPFGLYDLHGNVDEWCHDWFAADFYARSPETDPICSTVAEGRVRRGGAWDMPITRCRSAFRGAYAPYWRFHDLGFRVVRVSTEVE
jgi:formylglycine-generating enzyme required for sulfatase activity